MTLQGTFLLLLCCTICLVTAHAPAPTPISYTISGDNNAIQGAGLSVCATFDFWPAAKTDYGNSSWIDAGIFDSNLHHPLLIHATKALLRQNPYIKTKFNPVLRIGGTLGDHIVYDMGNSSVLTEPCVPIYINSSNPTHFSGGCLNLTRWVQIHDFCRRAECQIVYGLNALYGGKEHDPTKPWDSSNAEALIKMTALELGYDRSNTMYGFELGNELSGGAGGIGHINASEYAYMFQTLYEIVTKYYPYEATRPYLLGPDMINGDADYMTEFLQALADPSILFGATYHNYMAPGKDSKIDHEFMNPVWLQSQMSFIQSLGDAFNNLSWPSQLWMGETGGAYNSGRNTITNAFEGSFWYGLELGLMANANHSVHCRQALIGGAYALIQVHQIVTHPSSSLDGNGSGEDLPLPHPNPDYFTALLFQTLVGGSTVVRIESNDDIERGIRAFAFCQRDGAQGHVIVMLMNFNSTNTMSVSFSFNHMSGTSYPREEYHLTAQDHDLQSRIMELNGEPLLMTNNKVPPLIPNRVDVDSPVVVESHSIVFVHLLNTQAEACQ